MSTNQHIPPAWAPLDRTGLGRLLGASDAISVADINVEDIRNAPLVGLTRTLIERAIANNGLALTATGNLSRADVKALFDELNWPDFDKETALALNKVLNELDVFPVHIARIIAQEGKLLRKRKSRMLATNVAKELISPGREAVLFRQVFETLFWRIDTGYFDRVAIEDWPQDHVGVVLWCLSVSALDLMSPSTLMPICTVPYQLEPLNRWHAPEYAFEARILRPLTWLGLMEWRRSVANHAFSPYEYRKSDLFDKALKFDVDVTNGGGWRIDGGFR